MGGEGEERDLESKTDDEAKKAKNHTLPLAPSQVFYTRSAAAAMKTLCGSTASAGSGGLCVSRHGLLPRAAPAAMARTIRFSWYD